MSAGNKKRKRTESSDAPPAKIQTLESNDQGNQVSSDAKSRAASRQAKSERRSKKPAKITSSLSQAEKLTPGETTLLTLKSDPVTSDTLANGEDFVSLSVGPEQSFESKSDGNAKPQSKKQKKPKAKATAPLTTSTTPSTETKSKKDRFILFIGNLPYAATTPSITAHFNSLQPFTVRHNTDKATGRSKGFAFLEFESYDRMKTCIKLYHHSTFDPDHQPASTQSQDQEDTTFKRKPFKHDNHDTKQGIPNPNPLPVKSKNARRINVELTAGGGGSKSESRKDRIKQKNQKLSEQRERQHEKEATEKAKLTQEKRARPGSGANADQEDQADDRGNVHPSRLKRVAR